MQFEKVTAPLERLVHDCPARYAQSVTNKNEMLLKISLPLVFSLVIRCALHLASCNAVARIQMSVLEVPSRTEVVNARAPIQHLHTRAAGNCHAYLLGRASCCCLSPKGTGRYPLLAPKG